MPNINPLYCHFQNYLVFLAAGPGTAPVALLMVAGGFWTKVRRSGLFRRSLSRLLFTDLEVHQTIVQQESSSCEYKSPDYSGWDV